MPLVPVEVEVPRCVGGGPLKRLFVGRAIASAKAEHQLLPKFLALPVFSSDPLSSNAYLGPPLLDEIRAHTSRGDLDVTVVLSELVPRHRWENLLHNQTALFFKRILLFEPGVVVTSVPFHLSAPEVGTEAADVAPPTA